jgi:hypothetical protein
VNYKTLEISSILTETTKDCPKVLVLDVVKETIEWNWGAIDFIDGACRCRRNVSLNGVMSATGTGTCRCRRNVSLNGVM